MTTVQPLGKEHTHVTKQCVDCGTEFKFCFTPEQWQRYMEGNHVQRVFPELSDDDRELFISGVCGKCFNKLFADPLEYRNTIGDNE